MSEQNRPEGVGQPAEGEQTPQVNPWDAPQEAQAAGEQAAAQGSEQVEAVQHQAQELGEQATQQFDAAQQQPQQWGEQATQQFDAAQQQPQQWGQQPAQQWADQAAQQPADPWGQQSAPSAAQPAQQWGQQPADPWAQQPSAQSAAQPAQQWGQQPAQQWGDQAAQQWGQQPSAGSAAPAPYGSQWGQPAAGTSQPWGQQPGYGASPYSSGSGEKKGNKALPWIIVGALVLLAALYFLLAFLLKFWPFSHDLQALVDECTAGNAQSCNTLYQAAEEGSEAEVFGQTCGFRTDGRAECTDADMAAPVYSYGTSDAGDLGGTNGAFDAQGVAHDGTVGELLPGDAYGDNETLDRLHDACGDGNMDACDLLYENSEPGTEYEEYSNTCGGTRESNPNEWCNPNHTMGGQIN